MRVISGKCKGRKLVAPKARHVRPALDQVKEAIFNILYNVEYLKVLDLFAGSGSIGIEALSRGAKHATFVDQDNSSYNSIQTNIKVCGFENSSTIFKLPVSAAIKKLDKKGCCFDLIFVDPPYLKNLVNSTLEQLIKTNLINDRTIIVIEHHPKELTEDIPGLTLTDTRKYGQTLISFMKKSD